MKLLEKFNIIPNDIKYYEEAFAHSSYVNENRKECTYERLEFLGDAVLELIVTDFLYRNTNFEEGEMTKLRATYVCENALYEYATKLNFSEYIKVGKGELKNGGQYRKPIMADIFEAFIGAVYLDQGFDKAYEIIKKVITPYIMQNNDFLNDYKSILQEIVQAMENNVSYVLIEEVGPVHNRAFKMGVHMDGKLIGKGEAQNKKAAEQLAAKQALEYIENSR